MKVRLEIAEKELAQAEVEGFHDKIFVNDDLQKTYEQLEKYIFGFEDAVLGDETNENMEEVNDIEMVDDAPTGEVAKGEINGHPDATTNAADTLLEEKSSAIEGEKSTK